jgi:hypothetical protein
MKSHSRTQAHKLPRSIYIVLICAFVANIAATLIMLTYFSS